jgi:exopolysaccharide biosynthesis polyprenyl glycosylphosphotransferase
MSVSSIPAAEVQTPPEHTIAQAAGATAAPSVLASTSRLAVTVRGLLDGRLLRPLRVVLDAALLTLATSTQLATSSPEVAGQGLWWLFVPLTMVALTWGGRYRLAVQAGALGGWSLVVASTAVAAVSVVAVGALLDAPSADGSLLVEVWGLGTAGLIVGHIVLAYTRRRIRPADRGGTPTLIIGAGELGVGVERRLRERPELRLRPVGFLDDGRPAEQISSGRRAPILGTPLDLERVARETGAGHVIVAFAVAPDYVVAPLVRECARTGLAVSVVPRLFESLNGRLTLEDLGGLPLHTLNPTNPGGWQFATKHAIDRLAAALLLATLAPLFVGIAAAVKLFTPCPVFFKQRRISRDGRQFEIWKFSTMLGSTETRGQANGSWAAEVLGERRSPEAEPPDPRTRLGCFLRRTLLDELPQLFNVLTGDMSLVGPRPEQVPYVRRFEDRIHRYGERHRVKPGITGWAQVQGLRGDTSLVDRVEADNFYVENWSWWLDLKILVLTAVVLFRALGGASPRPRGSSTAAAPDSSRL